MKAANFQAETLPELRRQTRGDSRGRKLGEGSRLADYLVAHDINQIELARMINMTDRGLRWYTSGRRRMKPELVVVICRVLSCHPSEIVEPVEATDPATDPAPQEQSA